MLFIRECRCVCCNKKIYKTPEGNFYDFAYHAIDENEWKVISIGLEGKKTGSVIGYICPDCLDKYKITTQDFV